jgi:hypothetical protein
LVKSHPQDVVVFILNTASPWIIPERFTAPQHTRFILPPIHPTKFFACLAGWYFSLRELYLENFISRPDVIPTFRQCRCKTGAGTAFGANGDPPYMSSTTSTYFLRLNNSETFVENAF